MCASVCAHSHIQTQNREISAGYEPPIPPWLLQCYISMLTFSVDHNLGIQKSLRKQTHHCKANDITKHNQGHFNLSLLRYRHFYSYFMIHLLLNQLCTGKSRLPNFISWIEVMIKAYRKNFADQMCSCLFCYTYTSHHCKKLACEMGPLTIAASNKGDSGYIEHTNMHGWTISCAQHCSARLRNPHSRQAKASTPWHTRNVTWRRLWNSHEEMTDFALNSTAEESENFLRHLKSHLSAN